MSDSKCSSRQSHSDYCSVASYSSDEESTSGSGLSSPNRTVLPAGVCPNCHRIYEQPVSLQCGHSLCLTCCQKLLNDQCKSSRNLLQRSTPRMGISSISRVNSCQGGPVIHRTPKCLVCGAAANQAAPIPNLELDNFLRNIKSFRWNGLDQTISTTKRRWEDEGFSIHECKIAVIGAKGVGKTCFARVQYSNEIMFPDMLNEMDDSDSYVIDIVDNMEMKKSFSAAHGIIIMYSIADRQSFYEAAEVYKQLEQGREHNQPIVLVGSKRIKTVVVK
ncbi:unnamed protein product [Caenorhabditis angaria]|uniref:RING-type domain-containing protein n=1 Tax=Caenorhabditis angaria TaxID=860376 RepID=A0A9P1IR68_9PELO|nr:unnamed protein product [Caenorhabditis angaria]